MKSYNARNNMERNLQRKYYNFDSIKNIIRCKGYPVRIIDRWEKSNFKRGTYAQIFFCTIQFFQ